MMADVIIVLTVYAVILFLFVFLVFRLWVQDKKGQCPDVKVSSSCCYNKADHS